MTPNTNSDGVIATELPLEVAASIEGGGGGGNDEGKGKIRWNKVLDLVEAKNQVLFSLPMIFTNVSYYAITLVCVMIAGHHGRLELAGATLGNSWAFVSGFACMSGLSGALESLCGQAFGGKLYRMLGLHLQASCILTIMFASIISVAWFYTQPILILLHQDPHIAKAAALYIKYLIPGLFAYGILQNILRFLQTQSIVIPLLFFSVFSASINFGIAYALVHRTSLGYKGAPVAASISLWISTISLAAYVLFSKRLSHTWQGFSLESLRFIVTNLKLALPSAAMVCLEYWAFEILVFMAGMMPNSQVSTSLIAMCVNTSAVAFMTLYGLSAATSTRVSNELGAGNLDRAKKAMVVSLKLSVLLALIIITMLALGHNIWARFFTGDNHEIINPFASLTPFLVISIAVDSIQVVLSGVARGCGWQHLVVWANLATFYFIGIPIAAILGFKLKLHVKGLWIGLICGLFCQTGILLLIALCRKWRKIDMTERKENENPIYV